MLSLELRFFIMTRKEFIIETETSFYRRLNARIVN